MRERPILFSGSMVEAILDGRKTQTRRVIHPQPDECIWFDVQPTPYRHVINPQQPNVVHKNIIKCPYGKVGDSLWVRETWCLDIEDPYVIPKTQPLGVEIFYRADGEILMGDQICTSVWKPPIFMPRWASRITLEITNIRVERVKDISARDVIAEGVWDKTHTLGDLNWQREWIEKWNAVNKKRGYDWDSNPWVWVLEFRQASNEPA